MGLRVSEWSVRNQRPLSTNIDDLTLKAFDPTAITAISTAPPFKVLPSTKILVWDTWVSLRAMAAVQRDTTAGEPLSLTIMADLDERHPPNAINKVQRYVQDQATRKYPVQHHLVSPARNPPAALSPGTRLSNSQDPSSPPAPHRTQQRLDHASSGSDDRRGGHQRAMTLGGEDRRPGEQQRRQEQYDREQRAESSKKVSRPGLVASMRARTGPVAMPLTAQELKTGSNEVPRQASSSPALVARINDPRHRQKHSQSAATKENAQPDKKRKMDDEVPGQRTATKKAPRVSTADTVDEEHETSKLWDGKSSQLAQTDSMLSRIGRSTPSTTGQGTGAQGQDNIGWSDRHGGRAQAEKVSPAHGATT